MELAITEFDQWDTCSVISVRSNCPVIHVLLETLQRDLWSWHLFFFLKQAIFHFTCSFVKCGQDWQRLHLLLNPNSLENPLCDEELPPWTAAFPTCWKYFPGIGKGVPGLKPVPVKEQQYISKKGCLWFFAEPTINGVHIYLPSLVLLGTNICRFGHY